MLDLKEVNNVDIDEIKQIAFDISIFASGYESRSVFLAKNLDLQSFGKTIVFGFAEYKGNEVRKTNDSYYESNSINIAIVSSQEEKDIYDYLITVFKEFEDKKEITILIDYTSMSRLWYSGILNFVRYQEKEKITVYFNYSLGKYTSEFLDYSYTSINSLPSHEGSLSSNNKTLLVLAIGFSPYLVQSVIEEIEPNQTIGILPIPNILKEYEEISEKIKDNILTKDIDDWIKCPINNLENIFRTYAELASNNVHRKDLIFLSLGPKIFTLASIIVAQRFEQVTCLYLKSGNGSTEDVGATGDFICNRITYS
ncbi:MAG: hypothetical protein M3Q58_03270 [Bacteroidota bacterium]|nr:hypothetical protein [Bacteroidota bacterium]